MRQVILAVVPLLLVGCKSHVTLGGAGGADVQNRDHPASPGPGPEARDTVGAAAPVTLHAIYITDRPPRIDGRLDDAAWKTTKPLTDFVSCADLAPARARTEVRLTYDRANLYLAYRLEEPHLGSSKVRARVKKHDDDLWRDDRSETFFWLQGGEGAGYYQLAVNMLNVTEDRRDGSKSWEPRWESAVRVNKRKRFWTVEARIPFSAFGRAVPASGTRWRANFGRERYALPDHDSWARITGSFHQKHAFGSITFRGRRETVPPARIKEISATRGRYHGETVLSWTAVGDDGVKGSAASYDVRYSSRPIQTKADFSRATPAGVDVLPGRPGQREQVIVRNLSPGQRLHFAVMAVDDCGNQGPHVSTAEPTVIPAGALNPKFLTIEPTLESAGIVLRVEARSKMSNIRADYRQRGSGRWIEAHPFTRLDRHHAATSLIGLRPGTEHELRIRRGGAVIRSRFRTRPAFTLPRPLRVVDVRNDVALRRAVAEARPGDEIRVHPGSYRGGLTIRRSGTAKHPIVIRGVVPATGANRSASTARGLPVIDGKNQTYNGVLIEGSRARLVKHVVLDHLRVQNATGVGVHLLWAAWCVVQHCQVYDSGKLANVHVNKGGPQGGRHLIQLNHIADKKHRRGGFSHRAQPGRTYYGFKQDNYAGPGSIVRRNLIEGHSDGIAPSGDESDAPKVAENLPDVGSRWFNHSADISDNVIRDHADDAIELDGIAVNMRVLRNRITQCQNAISISPVMPGPFFIVRNRGYGFNESAVKLNTKKGRGIIRNVFFYHNTFVHGGRTHNPHTGGAIMTIWAGTPSKNILFANNIFSGKRELIAFQGLAHRPAMDFDLWFSTKGKGTFNRARSTFRRGGLRWEEHGLFANPRLGADQAPRPGSPVRDRGVVIPGINPGYSGKVPDIGAVELGN